MRINTLFLFKLDNKFSRGVLALKQLNIPIKINSAKNAVIIYLLEGSVLYSEVIHGFFKKKIHSNDEYILKIDKNKNPDLKLIGLLRMMFDPRVTLQQQVSEQLKEYFGDKVFKTVIPRNVRLAEAPSFGLPGVLYDKSSKGALAYQTLGVEFLKRMKKYKKSLKEKKDGR